MSSNHRRGAFAAAVGVLVTLIACSGSQGSQGTAGTPGAPGAAGAAGPQGPAGADGRDAVSTGIISGALTTANGAAASPVPGATVSVLPDQKVTATTAADGTFSLTVPVGTYTVVFTKSPGITTTQVAGVSVVAGATATVNQSVAFSPIKLTVAAAKSPAGFGAAAALTAAATGATGPVTYTWTLKSGPYVAAKKPALAASGATATFTTNTFKELLESSVVKYPPLFVEPRPSFIPLSFNQITQASYVVSVTATDGTYSQTATATVAPAVVNAGVIAQGSANMVPVGINLVANDPTASSWAWTLTAPAGAPIAALVGADTQYPSFTPTAAGVWTLKNGATTLTVTAGTYVGMGKFIDAAADETKLRCSTCHLANPPAQFALWQTSRHRNSFFQDSTQKPTYLFEKQFSSGTYSGECLACHAVGFTVPEFFPEGTPAIGNHGFADAMEEVGWSIPTVKTPAATAWAALDPKLKALVGDQCEVCHGPLSAHISPTPLTAAPSGTYSASTCLVCHDEPGHHEEPAWWVKSPTGHANTQLAMDVGANGSADCARCHSAQGFVAWRKQMADGVSGEQPLQVKGAGGAYVAATAADLQAMGLDKAHVQPQTCEACHDSHTTRLRIPYEPSDPNGKLLLKDGVTGMMPAGFSATGVGMGALCMTCHNSHGGAHGEGLAPTDAPGAHEYGPHAPTQSDMLMGENAYFVSGFNLSKHALIVDTCVGCHMKYYPTSFGTVGGTGLKYGAGGNHTFKADGTVCANCHPNATDDALQGQVKAGLENVRAAILAKVKAAVGAGAYTVVDAASSASIALDGTNPIVDLDVTTVHGKKALVLTFTNAVAATGSKRVTVLAGDIAVGGQAVIGSATSADYSTMGKALWNYLLVAQDGSFGVHNPSFALEVLSATQKQVAGLAAIPY
jgi:carboxypeptidase family protein